MTIKLAYLIGSGDSSQAGEWYTRSAMSMTREYLANSGSNKGMDSVSTKRLRLEPARVAHRDAEQSGGEALGKLLRAKVPSNWPPEVVAPPKAQDGVEWVTLYVVHEPRGEEATVIGFAGIARWPPESRTMQVGVALLPEWQGNGVAPEIGVKIADWALQQPGISRIVCDIPANHQGAAKALQKAGYSLSNETPGSGFARWERKG